MRSKPSDKALESVKRMSLQERIDRWVSRKIASLTSKLMRKLLAPSMGNAGPASARQQPVQGGAIPLHRDPWCGTYVSSEISFPLEHAGQVLHFCSAECRSRYRGTSQRAASA
jgi:YHS domain-containing protein